MRPHARVAAAAAVAVLVLSAPTGPAASAPPVDPAILFASYLGSADEDAVVSVQTDASEHIYVFGRTLGATTFPASEVFGTETTTTPKCFLAKFSPDGTALLQSLLFADSTEVGGDAMCDAMKVMPDGRVAVLYTSNMFGAFVKTVRTFADQGGQLASVADVRALHLEGLLPARGIDIDSSNNLYVIGACVNARAQTPAPVFAGGFRRAPSGAQNCRSLDNAFNLGPSESVLAKYDAAGNTLYATYIGGTGDQHDTALALDARDDGVVFVAGSTNAADYPVTADAFQSGCVGCLREAFVTAVDTLQSNEVPGQDSLRYSTFISGVYDDVATAVRAEPDGSVVLAGQTSSYDFAAQQQDAHPGVFVMRMDPAAPSDQQLLRLTLFPYGQGGFAYADQFAFFGDGSVAVSGFTRDPNFPLVNALPVTASGTDAPFAALFASDGSIVFSSLLAPAVEGVPRIAAAGAGDLVAALPSATDGLATSGAFQILRSGDADVLLMRIAREAQPNQPPFVAIIGTPTGLADLPSGALVQLVASVFDPEGDPLTYTWSGPFTNTPVTTEQALRARLPLGVQTVTVTVDDGHGHPVSASITIDVVPNTAPGQAVTVTPPDQSWSGQWGEGFQTPVSITFPTVSAPGTTSLRTRIVYPPVPPPGMQFGTPPLHYDLATTVSLSGDVAVCIDYRGMSFAGPDASVRMFRQDGGSWLEVPATNTTSARRICGTTPALGTFALFTPANPANEISLVAGATAVPPACPLNGTPDPNEGGAATDSTLCSARGMAYDPVRDVVYVVEEMGSRIRRIELGNGNRITTVAGNGVYTGSLPPSDPRDDDQNHGDPLSAPMRTPLGLTLDAVGNLYFTEYGADRIRKVDFVQNKIFTVAGRSSADPCPFPGTPNHPLCKALTRPVELVVDSAGAVLFTEFVTDDPRLFRITPGADGSVDGSADERIEIVGGNGQQNLDVSAIPPTGIAPAAIPLPAIGLALAADGSLYAAGLSFVVRIDPGPDGLIDGANDTAFHVAGNQSGPVLPYFGDGVAATVAPLLAPWSVAVAPNGDVLVGGGGHYQGATIRRIEAVDGVVTGAADETISTIAGFQVFDPAIVDMSLLPFSDGDGHALSSVFGSAWSLVHLPNGDLLVSDRNSIRRIGSGHQTTPGPAVITIEETVVVADDVAVTPPVTIDVLETVVVSDEVAILPAALIEIAEAVTVMDTPVLTPSALIGVEETVSVNDEPAITPTAPALPLTLTPPTASSPTGTTHTVMAELSNAVPVESRVVVTSHVGRALQLLYLPGGPNSPLTVHVANGGPGGTSTITIMLAADALGGVISTAAHVVAAINATPGAVALAHASVWPGSSGNGIAHSTPSAPFATLHISASGANTAATSCTTTVPGFCALSYTGAASGTDVISAYADLNGNDVRDGNEPTATASKQWGDSTPPVLTLPADITTPATRLAGASVSFVVSALDDTSGAIMPVCSHASGSNFAPGTTTVTCTATDAAGNVATGSFTVTVTSIQLGASATFTKNVAGDYEARIVVANVGTGTPTALRLTVAQLNNVSTSGLPLTAGALAPGATTTFTVVFPASAGRSGPANALKLQLTWPGGNTTISLRAILP